MVLGVLGVLLGSMGGQGIGEGWGGSMEVPWESWRGCWNLSFSCLQKWTRQWSNEIWMFSVLGRLVKRSVVFGFGTFCSVSKLLLLRNSDVNLLYTKTISFKRFQYGIFIFQWTNDAADIMSGCACWCPGRQMLMEVFLFFTILLFTNYMILWPGRLHQFPAKSNMSFLVYTCCTSWWCPWSSTRTWRWNIEY